MASFEPNDFPRNNPQNPNFGVQYHGEPGEEELGLDIEITPWDWALFVTRCLAVVIFLVAYIMLLINVVRGTRLKNWRLYSVVALFLFCWLGMSLYQDYIDEFFVRGINIFAQRRSIYWCLRNILHGMTLYLIILLLSHLSDFQHKGIWFWFVAFVLIMPLTYSIALLIIDLRVHPDQRGSWQWSIGIETFRVFTYNFITTILLFAFSPRFCTNRLYGTYSEERSPLVVSLSRWTFAFLLLHNLTAMASYGSFMATRIPNADVDLGLTSLIHRWLDEVAFIFIVMAVPVSYLIGIWKGWGGGRYGTSSEVEMDKMDKIYQEVWSTNQDRPRKGRNGAVVNTNPEPSQTLTVSTLAGSPGGASSLNNSTNSIPNGESEDKVASLGNVRGRGNAREVTTAEKRRKRESYFEAVSMGSINDDRPGSTASSFTSEPVDL